MPIRRIVLLLTPGLLALAAPAGAAEPAPSAQAVEFFEKQVRPVLATKCQSCHGPEKQRGGLRLDSRAGMLQGGGNGPVLQAQDPEKSPLIQAVRRTGDVKMPPKEKLDAQTVASLETWVKMGAPWPTEVKPVAAGKSVAEVRRRHWSFQPVRLPGVPAVKNSGWVRTPVDAFVLARLEAKGLAPASEADRHVLVRRLYLDLHGLPPTPEEVQAFLADRSPDAYEKLVGHLLASSRYGERWARHWLDVARYADTRGYVFTDERRYPFSYTYRDYVIRAFNEDLPYDQFLLQQLAADQLPLGKDTRPLAAMGFLTLGRRFLNNIHDIIDDRMDVTMRGLQGLTVACARCHDHKFDPIPTRDYYSLYGVFASSVEPRELPAISMPEPTPELAAFEKELAKRKAAVEKFRTEHKKELAQRNRKFRDQLRGLQKQVDQWQATAPAAPPRAMVLQDAAAPMDSYVFLRGNPNNHGPSVPRQLPEVLAGDKPQPFQKGSGRLELARAIASKDNPLTARVLVNRLWLHHFGAGLVRTPSDFGLRGEPSTHPELLDWLAATFMREGWSIKKMHRVILLSSTYRQASDHPGLAATDPDNRLLGRMSRQRLDFESLRDTLLTVAGHLDTRMGGRAVDLTTAPFTTRRSVYGFIDRQNLPGLFRTFDFASPDASTPQRYTTTVPQQALFLMNSPFVVEQARRFAARPDVVKQPDDAERIQRMHWIAFGRPAEPDEVALGLRFVQATGGKGGGGARLTPWEQYAQVLLLSNELAFMD
jgi:mono/diheme cytochrome c family protein